MSVTSFCLLYEKLQSLWFVRLWCVYFSIFTLYFSKTFTQSIFIYLISPFCYWCWKIHSREEKAGIADERKTLLEQCPWAEERRQGRSPQEESLAVTRSVGGSSIMFGKNDSAGTQMQVEKWILWWELSNFRIDYFHFPHGSIIMIKSNERIRKGIESLRREKVKNVLIL